MPRSIRRADASPSRTGRSPPRTEGAEKGDRVTISFQGTIDGEPFEGGSGEDVPMLLGSGQFIPGFEDHLIGIKAGESRTFDVKFPDDYPAPALAGKDATFAVTVKTVEAPGDGHGRRRFRQDAWPGIARQAARRGARAH